MNSLNIYKKINNVVEDTLHEKYILDMYINLLHNIQHFIELCEQNGGNLLEITNIDEKLIDRVEDDLNECGLDIEILDEDENGNYGIMIFLDIE